MAQPFLGEIRIFGGNFAPQGWALCQGQLMPISQNVALFSLLGTTYGGDGIQTFALPDLQGRVPIHGGNGAGLSAYSFGDRGGLESVALTQSEAPAHNHGWAVLTAAGTADKEKLPGGYLANGILPVYDNSLGPTTMPLAASTIAPVGASQPHENMAPYLVLTFIIALEGIFPSRS